MLDKVTEMVAHMIGIFHTTMEEGRMRDSYLKSVAHRHTDTDTAPLLSETPTLKAPYQLEDFMPRIRYEGEPQDSQAPHMRSEFLGVPENALWFGTPRFDLPEQTIYHTPASYAAGHGILTLEPPGAVVTITHQSAFLSDNDLMRLTDSATVFIDPAVYDAQLHGYQVMAQAIRAPLDTALPALDGGFHDHAMALYDQIALIEGPHFSGANVTVLHGDAALGIHENGVVVDQSKKFDDVMPAYFKAQAEADETSDAIDAPPAWAPDPFHGLAPSAVGITPPPPDPGHTVVAGANLALNQTNIGVAWLDAPVIAVMGDVVNLNIISQTNMLVEHGNYSGPGAALGSMAYNTAVISLESSRPPAVEGEEDAAAGAPLSVPSNWVVTRIDGDLLTVNHSQQYSFITDHDRADIGFYSANTYIALGDNTVMNLTNILEIGYGYDLIIVGGNMININQITQMNVLIDNDLVTYSGIQPTTLSMGDNLLFNGASISAIGIDTYKPMQDNFANAATSLADGGLTIDESVAHDSVFEGTDILRVLYISGDAVTINMVDQTNILGDSDQVHLALDNFQSTTGADITVTTGSNAAANLASIQEFGVDSVVSVGGDVYSDALLYQAGFIDTDANPLGVALPALANEAVAFLADGMIGPDAPEDAGIAPTTIEATHTPDVMQSMLA